MESTELTFEDEADGGAFPENIIPELTDLAKENEDFSGDSSACNGGVSLYGTTWTMGAMFGQTSGLPLRISVGKNNMSLMSDFFPDLTTLGDILSDEGYDNTLVIGSNATFGGRRMYFTEHGGYDIRDYNYAVDNGLIPEGYKVWWGYEDEKLFSFAKDTITEKAAGDAPFNVTLLTVDTHFEDGYVCDLCPTTFGDNQYANVFACASRQVSGFIAWCQTQDWYDNTTIIISGDHPTMDSDFCDDVPDDYQRKVYTCYINAAAETDPDMGERSYSTFDDFPTALAAIGAEIDGDRLGLGTNLFSSEPTLIEQYGVDEINSELIKKSPFIERVESTGELSEKYKEKVGQTPKADVYMSVSGEEDSKDCSFHVTNICYMDEELRGVYIDITENGSDSAQRVNLELGEDGDYYGTAALTEETLQSAAMSAEGIGESGTVYNLYSVSRHMTLCNSGNAVDYVKSLGLLHDCAVLISVRSGAYSGRTEELEEAFASIGLTHLPGKNQSYIALIENGNVIIDECSDEALSEQGSLMDGAEFSVYSAGKGAGDSTSISVDGKTLSKKALKKGFSIAVYDEITHEFADYFRYKTNAAQPGAVISIGSKIPLTDRYVVTVASITGCDKKDRAAVSRVDDVRVRVWSEDDPSYVETFSLTDVSAEVGGDLKSFSERINLEHFKGKNVYIDAIAVNEAGYEYHVGKITASV